MLRRANISAGRWGQDRCQKTDGKVVGKSRQRIQAQEEEVLDDDGRARKEGGCE